MYTKDDKQVNIQHSPLQVVYYQPLEHFSVGFFICEDQTRETNRLFRKKTVWGKHYCGAIVSWGSDSLSENTIQM